MKPNKQQRERSYKEKRNYNIACFEIPFYVFVTPVIKELAAITALYGVCLNPLGAEGTLFCAVLNRYRGCL